MQYIKYTFSLLLLLCFLNPSAQCLENISGEYFFGTCGESELCIPVHVSSLSDTDLLLREEYANGSEQWTVTVNCTADSLLIHPNLIGPCGNVYKVDGVGTFNEDHIYLQLHWMPYDNVYGGEEHWTTRTYHRTVEETSTENPEPPQEEMEVFPNPFMQFITLLLPEEESTIEILDTNGNRITSMQVTSITGVQLLDLGFLAQGSYFIRSINSEGKSYCRKIIKAEP